MNSQKRILIAPLNWGLGHATRCMPIINTLSQLGAEVVIASDGRAAHLLQKEYPHLTHLQLPAYNIRYWSSNMFLNIAPQLPKIQWAMLKEYFKTQKIIKAYNIDAIISDNRFGCFSPKIPSIFLTHQLNIKIPNPLVERLVKWINHFYIKRFDACWIPDIADSKNLGGSLSHGDFSFPITYLGVLSRMSFFNIDKKYDIAAVLSGPEPQRTILEKKLITQLAQLPYRSILVKGKTNEQENIKYNEHLDIQSFMTANELNDTLLASDLVISRAGYSTIMDLAQLGKKALLIPTPGQTEQEYLAQYFKQSGIFYTQSQEALYLETDIPQALTYNGLKLPNNDALHHILSTWLQQL